MSNFLNNMGYAVHITKAKEWHQSESLPITEAEWQDLVNSDPELQMLPSSSTVAEWNSHPEWPNVDFRLSRGYISITNPDKPILRKMIEIARRLNARVVGDDGESYNREEDYADF